MRQQHEDCLLSTERSRRNEAMKPQKLALLALIVVSITLLGALLLNNKTLCDVSFRSGGTEVVAHMAYESR